MAKFSAEQLSIILLNETKLDIHILKGMWPRSDRQITMLPGGFRIDFGYGNFKEDENSMTFKFEDYDKTWCFYKEDEERLLHANNKRPKFIYRYFFYKKILHIVELKVQEVCGDEYITSDGYVRKNQINDFDWYNEEFYSFEKSERIINRVTDAHAVSLGYAIDKKQKELEELKAELLGLEDVKCKEFKATEVEEDE